MKHLISFFGHQTLQHSIIVLAGNILSSLLGFIFVFLVARKLGPVDFGIFSTLIGYITFVSAIADLGISQSLVAFVAKASDKVQKKEWISTSLAVLLVNVVLISLAAVLLYEVILRQIWNHPHHYGLLVGATIIAISLTIYLLSVFQSLQQFVKRVIFDTSFSLIRILIVILLIASSGSIRINQVLVAVFIAYCLALVIGLVFAKHYLARPKIDREKIKAIFGFSKWLAIQNICANLYGRLDVLMLAWLSSNYITGIYAAAGRFMTIFPLVVSSLSAVVSPRFAAFTFKKENYEYVKRMGILVSVVSIGMLFLIPLAQPILLLAYGNEFTASISVFHLLVIANIPLVLSIPFTNSLIYFFNQSRFVSFVSLIQLIGLVILNKLLIPIYSASAPAYALVSMNTLGLLAYYLYYKRQSL